MRKNAKTSKIAKSAKRVAAPATESVSKHIPLKSLVPSGVTPKLARRRLRAAVAAGKIAFHGARERWLIPAARKADVLAIITA